MNLVIDSIEYYIQYYQSPLVLLNYEHIYLYMYNNIYVYIYIYKI